MKKAKLIKKIKNDNVKTVKDSYSLKDLILIIMVLVVILGIFYLITFFIVKPDKDSNIKDSITEIDYKKITLNNLLNRKEDMYYVLVTKESLYDAINSDINYTQLYNNYINEYSSLENALPFYNIDLDDALNKNYVGNELNISNDISEIKLNDEVLFKIKDGKIDKYFVGNSKILKALSDLKESN